MKKPSPFLVTLRVAGYCALLSLALTCFLFTSCTTPGQAIVTVVVLVLLLMLSLAIGFYFGMKQYHAKMQAVDQAHRREEGATLQEHYPASAAVQHYLHNHSH